jgi:hypothetical protein
VIDNKGNGSGVIGTDYEAPHLVPIGNLFDLLAGSEVTGCDAADFNETNGTMAPGCTTP